MIEGKVLGKGLFYIEGLDDTHNLEELSTLTCEQFRMFLSFCNERELDKMLLHTQKGEHHDKEVMILNLLSKCK